MPAAPIMRYHERACLLDLCQGRSPSQDRLLHRGDRFLPQGETQGLSPHLQDSVRLFPQPLSASFLVPAFPTRRRHATLFFGHWSALSLRPPRGGLPPAVCTSLRCSRSSLLPSIRGRGSNPKWYPAPWLRFGCGRALFIGAWCSRGCACEPGIALQGFLQIFGDDRMAFEARRRRDTQRRPDPLVDGAGIALKNLFVCIDFIGSSGQCIKAGHLPRRVKGDCGSGRADGHATRHSSWLGAVFPNLSIILLSRVQAGARWSLCHEMPAASCG